jgi:hypothetical protein
MVIELTAVSFIDSILSTLLRARDQANRQPADDLVIVAAQTTSPAKPRMPGVGLPLATTAASWEGVSTRRW